MMSAQLETISQSTVLFEEVEGLSRDIRHELRNLLRNLINYLLQRAYWESEREQHQGYWRGNITEIRLDVGWEVKASSSLESYCQEIFSECYQDARKLASPRSQLPLSVFPEQPIANLEQVLNENWFPYEFNR